MEVMLRRWYLKFFEKDPRHVNVVMLTCVNQDVLDLLRGPEGLQ
jgi:hypothetical protein